jgi:hypothetical protein
VRHLIDPFTEGDIFAHPVVLSAIVGIVISVKELLVKIR